MKLFALSENAEGNAAIINIKHGKSLQLNLTNFFIVSLYESTFIQNNSQLFTAFITAKLHQQHQLVFLLDYKSK